MSTTTGPDLRTSPRTDTDTDTDTQESTMSTATLPQPTSTSRADVADRPEPEDVGPVPFLRLARLELRKMLDTRAGLGLMIAIVAITALAMGGAMWVMRDSGAPLIMLLLAAASPQGLLLPILGIMTAANEWSQRTALITFTQEPRRLRVMVAKASAALVLGLAVLVATLVLAAGAHVLSMTLADGGQIDLTLTTAFLINLVVLQAQGVLMGVAFGALLLNVPLGIVAYVLVPTLTPVLFQLTSWLREHAAWLDLSTAGQPMLNQDWLTGQQWAQVGTTTALWVLLPLALGFWRVVRKEVK